MKLLPKASMKTIWLVGTGLVGLALWSGQIQLRSYKIFRERDEANERKAAELHRQLESAHRTIGEVKEIEQQAAAVRTGLDRWATERQTGPTVVWFPGWLKAQLLRRGIAEAQIRLNTEVPEPGLPGFKRTCWNVNLPPQEGVRSMTALLLAVRDIEQRDRFVKILDCSIRAVPEEPARLVGAFNVEVLIPE